MTVLFFKKKISAYFIFLQSAFLRPHVKCTGKRTFQSSAWPWWSACYPASGRTRGLPGCSEGCTAGLADVLVASPLCLTVKGNGTCAWVFECFWKFTWNSYAEKKYIVALGGIPSVRDHLICSSLISRWQACVGCSRACIKSVNNS